MVHNIHERIIQADLEACSSLLRELGTPKDRLWPKHRWPPMRLEGALELGTKGYHGPISYVVDGIQPGRSVRFRFTAPDGFIGWHGFEVQPLGPGRVRLRHELHACLEGWARFVWPLSLRWLHDACVEDALDRAEDELEGRAPRTPRPFSTWVSWLRSLRPAPRSRQACDFSLEQLEAELFDPALRGR